jgi:hypothetical protein
MTEAHKREARLWMACAVLALALFYVVTLDMWGLRLWGYEIDYTKFGNWGDAISGIGTTIAVVVALAGLYWERRSHRTVEIEKQRDAETAVFQWLTSKEVRDAKGSLAVRLWDLRIQNSTVAPIYQWTVTIAPYPDHLCGYTKRPLIPGENIFNLPFLDGVEPNVALEPALSFRSRSGTIWTRLARGTIEAVPEHALACAHTPSSNTSSQSSG